MIPSSLAHFPRLTSAEISQVAHPLYPVEQVFLWLPGFAGEEHPYCSYNEALGASGIFNTRLYQEERLHDTNGAFYSPLFPIDPGTYICWHLDVTPPMPFHGVPVIHSLSTSEMGELALQVLIASEEDLATYADPLIQLCNNRKSFILATLARMGLLSTGICYRDKHPRQSQAEVYQIDDTIWNLSRAR